MPSYLGQNFLKDVTYINFIVQKIDQYAQQLWADTIIEIWPWKCALTRKLIHLGKKVILFEKDTDLCEFIDSVIDNSDASVIWWDVLEQDPHKLLAEKWLKPWKTIVAGNLPYYITSPILTKFFGWNKPEFDIGIFMVQKEVADKVKVDAEKKSFLWWLLNYHFEVRYLKTVPAKAFSPAPKVQSAIISLVRKKETPRCEYDQMRVLLERISMYKRKTLGKSRKMAQKWKDEKAESKNKLVLENYLYELPDVLAGKRIEELSWEDMDVICGNKK